MGAKVSPVLRGTLCFFAITDPHWFIQFFFTSFFAQIPENGGEEFEEGISFRREALNVFHLGKLSSCGSLDEFSSTSGESFLVMAK